MGGQSYGEERLFGEFREMVIREIRHKNERAEMAECCQNKSMKEIEIGIKMRGGS